MPEKKFSVTNAELEVLKVLWAGGPGTVCEVRARFEPSRRGRAYTTLQTLLNRLQTKGCVKSDKGKFPHVYRASVSREALVREGLDNLAGKLLEGSTTPLVTALMENERFSAEEIARFRRLLDEAEGKQR